MCSMARTTADQAMATRKLVVKVVGAHGLAHSKRGLPSAFVVLSFDSQQFRTSVKENDENPVWNDTFCFNVLGRPKIHKLVLQVCVYDTNTSVQGEMSLIGKVKVNGASFRPSDTGPSNYPLRLGMIYRMAEMVGLIASRGKLGLNLYIKDERSTRAQEPNIASLYSPPMALYVEVVSAHVLKPMDRQGSASTFVEVTFDYVRFRTAIKVRDRYPVWNEWFYFNVWGPSSLRNLDIKAFVYHVHSSSKRSNTLLGKVKISGTKCRHLHGDKATYPLEKPTVLSYVQGDLSLKVYTIDNPSMGITTPAPLMDGVILHNQISRPHHFALQYLKKITNNFSEERIIGRGGSGAVYKGVVQNGDIIAVKKILPSFMPGEQKQFENEISHLTMLDHSNIVRVVGYCYEVKKELIEYDGRNVFADMEEKLVCYEYLPNGSLDNYISDETTGLDWSTRYNIIEGIYKGLIYLHVQNDKPIIHIDLKPANILLGEGMIPKIADFGLSRLHDQQQSIYTTSRLGTRGYMAREFVDEGKITLQLDIFSLGVIILEVVTGHRHYPDVITETSSDDFIKLALEKWRSVQRSPGYESEKPDYEQIKRCLQVGMLCVNHDHAKRPPITKVINMLQGTEIIDSNISNEEAA
ncbi:probable receptor-like protein kinase At3g17420 [Triticum dicoccoides]|uniref:probable receptor-like protein kinase At3g17420 n=1 Tax=Triticum dicoccoides TaxID=85692 RepID=UPI00188F7D97|nr:probable receptor-like protein kinase At3g17420 [Triticum dicoccoides]